MTDNLTCDAFLGGKLFLWQPSKGYRAGIDSVLLAASVTAEFGQHVLDLGCGVGTASLCLATRVHGLSIMGVEWLTDYVALARRNIAESNMTMKVFETTIENLPKEIRQHQFDHVIANPPYFFSDCRHSAMNPGKEAAISESVSLKVWVKVATKRLAPKGYFFVIHRTERLPDLLTAIRGQLGSIEIQPIASRSGQSANLFLLRAQKNGRAVCRLHPPLILHKGQKHTHDAESYRPEIIDILRRGKGLSWPRKANSKD
ncbi:MAG: methyltransferase [Aestuariivita sp.]|nr:methyltransferase [Aestuariivita sp.]